MKQIYENAINNRYDFVYFFDVENGNPNGNPDADNMPRMDPETGYGIVTDVCVKRKIRNFIEAKYCDATGFDIYVKQNAVLNIQEKRGLEAITSPPELKVERSLEFRSAMCKAFYDIRTFGAVMTTAAKDKTILNTAGQVRGPVQIGFARSIDPIVPSQITITRVAVTNEKDAENKSQEMGSKYIIPYAMYRQEGYISANLARTVTGFSDKDLEIFWESIIHMFDDDRSSSRGKMALRELIVFKHDSPFGNAPAHKLFDRINVVRKNINIIPRSYKDYLVNVNEEDMPAGISCIRMYS